MTAARRLAAILAADVVGYSRLMGEDEAGTARAVRERRKAVTPIMRAFGGRLVKTMGDGLLLEFPSVVAAVECAIAIQKLMAERNAGTPEGKHIVYRIGVNLGDVLIEDDDILGDGVNVAARLEQIAEPGGVCLSGSAYDHVRGKVDADFADIGEQRLKNIAGPVHAYSLSADAIGSAPAPSPGPGVPRRRRVKALAAVVVGAFAVALIAAGWFGWRARSPLAPAPVATAEDRLATEPRLSIVVLPFENLSSDPEQEYFADAITDDLTTDLSHLSDSFVIARNTAYTFKGKAVDVKQIGRELGVRYALEGSVRSVGETVAVNAQLISTETGAHVWADRFDGDRSRLGQLQGEFVARLANSLGVELVKAETLRATRERPDNADAVDLAMRARVASFRLGPAGLKEAAEDYERALDIDPGYVRAKIGLAHALATRVNNAWSTDPDADIDRAERLANEALSAEPNNALAHYAKALVYADRRKWDAAISEADAATDNDRNYAPAYALSGTSRIFLGRAAEGFPGVEAAMRLSPRDPIFPFWEFDICHLHSHLAQWSQAIEPCRRAIQGVPGLWYSYVDLIAAYSFLGRDAEAKAESAELLKLKPDFTIRKYVAFASGWTDNVVFNQQITRFAEGLRKAGLPEQ
jgi:adenylate cyclase